MSSPVPPPPPDDAMPPPPPDDAMPPPPPPGPPATTPPPPAAAPAGYGYAAPPKPPRPDVRPAAAMIVAGAIVSAIAAFLPWLTADGDTLTGTGAFISKDFELYDRPGDTVVGLAVIVFGLGVALFFAGRVLAVAIIAIVFAAFSLAYGLMMLSVVADTKDLAGTGDIAVGVILLTPAAGLSLAGSIWATSKRRRWTT